MIENWIVEETQNVDLKDARTNDRLRQVLAQLAGQPTSSIPAACGGHAEMTAAYRFFDNSDVTFDRILEAHAQATQQRVAAQSVVLMIQDTSEFDVTRPTQQVKGAGPLDGSQRRGLLLHAMHAFTPDGTPLGTAWAKVWARTEGRTSCAQQTRRARERVPIEQKESYRWVQSQQHAQRWAERCPETQLIVIGDSEADLYDLFVTPPPVDWIVRGCQNRALLSGATPNHLHEHLQAQPVRYVESVPVLRRSSKVACDVSIRHQPRTDRMAHVEVRSAQVSLRPPRPPDHVVRPVTVNVVLVSEVHPPDGVAPLEWLLLTSLPVESEAQIRQVVTYYKVRWLIEILFRVLKSGCRVEQRRFECIERLQNALAVYLVVAWRVLFTTRLARAMPTIGCEAVFSPDEWKAVWQILRRSPPPSTPPPLSEMTKMVAQLGGYVRRKNSPPGPQTLWIGLQRACDFAICWRTFGPGAHQAKDV